MIGPLPYLKETPSQTASPYVHIGLIPHQAGFDIFENNFSNVLVGPETQGERIRSEGRVFDGSGSGSFKESLGWRGGWHRDGSRRGSDERPRAVQAAPAPSAGPCCATLPAPVGRSRSALGRRPRASSRPGASATGSQSPNARAQCPRTSDS